MILLPPSFVRLLRGLSPCSWTGLQRLSVVFTGLFVLLSLGLTRNMVAIRDEIPPPPRRLRPVTASVPPLFILVGDSTTLDQEHLGGGWGGAFAWLLARGATASNRAEFGATTTGYIKSRSWLDTLAEIRANRAHRKVYVTIQFGHNDQPPINGVTLNETQGNLVYMARHVLGAGGYPILLSPLCRRDYLLDDKTVDDNLADYRAVTARAYAQVLAEMNSNAVVGAAAAAADADGKTERPAYGTFLRDWDGPLRRKPRSVVESISGAASVDGYAAIFHEEDDNDRIPDDEVTVTPVPRFADLNAASVAYIGAIGKTAAWRYNREGGDMAADTTHLNALGALVFGRMVADLLLGHPPTLVPAHKKDQWAPGVGNEDDGLSAWIEPNPFYSGRIWHGEPI